jgi:hypothetical protein
MSSLARKESPTFAAVYTIAEAARLGGLPPAQVRRWMSGRLGEHSTVGLDFLDLIELRCVKALVETGVSWQVLRAAYERAAEILRVDHPLATKRFLTDGYAILTRVAEPALLEIVTDRRVFSRLVNRYLAGEGGVDFDAGGMAARWWPLGKKRLVVIDPKRSFGQPIVNTEGVPTAVLYNAYLAESSSG